MMNEIVLDNRVILIKADEKTISLIKQEFTYKDSSKAMLRGVFDKRLIVPVCFLHKKGEYHWLYSGFLRQLLVFIKSNNLQFDFKDLRKVPDYEPNGLKNIVPGFELYDYQIQAVEKAIKNKVGIIKLPTSAGKTLIAAAILKALNLPFLFLVNRKGLATQTWKEFGKMGIDCGVCHSEAKVFKESMVATIGSVHKIPTLDRERVLIGDEIHRFGSGQFQEFLKQFMPPYRIGLSATPEGNSPFYYAKVRQFFGDVIYSVPSTELISNGVIAEPHIFFVRNWVEPEHDWPMTEARQIVDNKNRNGIIRDFVHNHKDKCILILVTRIEQGKTLERMIEGSTYVDGSEPIKVRESIRAGMESGEIKTVISTSIFNEGVNIKAIQVLINASARKSVIDTIQKLGRSLRVKEDKFKSVIIDFQDNGNYFLERQSAKRKNIWKSEGFVKINLVTIEELMSLDVEKVLRS